MGPPLKVFRVFKLGREWQVNAPAGNRGVHGSQVKSYLVDWACEAARRVDGEVHVCDRGGMVEAVHAYKDGVEQERPAPV